MIYKGKVNKKISVLMILSMMTIGFLFVFPLNLPYASATAFSPTYTGDSCDGTNTAWDDSAYSTARTKTTSNMVSSTDVDVAIGQYFYGGYRYYIYRSYLYFNTSAIPDTATISRASFNFTVSDASLNYEPFDLTVQNGQPTYPSNPLVTGDYDQSLYSGTTSKINTTGMSSDTRYKFDIDMSFVNKTGQTKLCLRSARDMNATQPGGGEKIQIYSGDYGLDSKKPTLTVFYNYSSNNAPTQSNPSPTNGSTGKDLQQWCHITVNDADGNSMTVKWYANTTGSYVLKQTNSSCVNSTYWWHYTQATSYSTIYYWRVDVNDGTDNTSIIYHFTTLANNAPVQSSPSPGNASTGISFQPWCHITMTDNDTMTVRWYENSTGSYVLRQTNSSVSTGTFWWHFTQANSLSTTYYWKVSANDGIANTSVIYNFTIRSNFPPGVWFQYPSYGAIGIPVTPWCHITILDINSDIMTIRWCENTTGSWVLRQTNASIPGGTYWWHFIQVTDLSTTYYWRILVDDSINTTNITMNFTTILTAFSIASFTYIQNGFTVIFNDTSTGTNPITTWSWDFGDGGTSTVKNPTHTYTVNGNFTVILTVGDGFGNYNTTSDLIIINVTIEGQMNDLIAIVIGVVEVVIVMIVVASIVIKPFKNIFKKFE